MQELGKEIKVTLEIALIVLRDSCRDEIREKRTITGEKEAVDKARQHLKNIEALAKDFNLNLGSKR